ncbi:hypothetical protein QR680_013225 [Steinernema hermaphroditum]|uniref:Uncharacterized protein n=1 Tax=Steinernema hermaphroditum TaxID=289476 RepID=A0AA39I656_9BILA|nr:hypothetical protein QR680_013225 [Steinernema hermaphroditum]
MTTILSKINNLFHRRRRTSSSAVSDVDDATVPAEDHPQRHKHSADCRHIRFNDKVTQIPPNAVQPRRHHSDSSASYNRDPPIVPRARSQSVRTRSRSEPTFFVIERRHVKSALHKQKSVDEAPATKRRSNSSSQVIRVDPGTRTVVHINTTAPRRCRDYYLI